MRIISIYAILLPVLIPALVFGNLVQNPSMEGSFISQPPLGEVAEYWTGWSNADEPGSFSEGGYAHDAFKSQAISWHGSGMEGFGPEGIYQQVGSLQPGQIYRVSVWFKFHFERGGLTWGWGNITCRTGADPDGGTDPDSVTNWNSVSDYADCDYYEGSWLNVVTFFSTNGSAASIFIEVDGVGWALMNTPEGEIPAPLDAYCCIDDVIFEPIQIGQCSTVEATSPVAADGESWSVITITVLDPNGIPIEGVPVSEITVNCTGSGNSIYGPWISTDANGQTIAGITSTVPETKTVSVTVLGTPLSDTAIVEFVPQWVKLTMLTSPSDVNAVTPTVGEHNFARNSVVDINAGRFIDCPDVYVFDHWEGDVDDPNSANTTIVMDTDKTVTAVFVATRQCGDECHPYPEGDLNKDCRVNFFDIAVIANNWLECTDPECD